MDDFFINENLKRFIFPDAPESWKCTENFFIDNEFCTILLEKKKVKSFKKLDTPKLKTPKSPKSPKSIKPLTPETDNIENDLKSSLKTPKSIIKKISSFKSTPKGKTPKTPLTSKSQKEGSETPKKVKKIELPEDENFEEITPKSIKSMKSSELTTEISKNLNLKGKENKNDSLYFLYEDLRQFDKVKKPMEIVLHNEKFQHLKSDDNIQDTFLNFASTCMEEYNEMKENDVLKFVESSRMYSKLILGILHANNYIICTPSELKQLRENTVQDLDDIKSFLNMYDIQENEIIPLFSEKIKKGNFIYLLVNKSSLKIDGCIWCEKWDKSKEYDYIKMYKNDDMEEITNALFVKGIGTRKSLGDSLQLKALLYTLIVSEFQSKEFSHVFWRAAKIGEFSSIKEISTWMQYFNCLPTFTLQEGITKLPKQDDSCELFKNQHIEFISSFRSTTRGLKALEYCKKNKLVKEDYTGLWKDFQDKTIEICLKKKDCYSNVYLNAHSFPSASELLGYFLIFKDLYSEKDMDSLTAIENKIL